MSCTKIANDIRWMGSGPPGRPSERSRPKLKEPSIKLRQGQPGHGRGPDPGVGPGHRQRRRHHGRRPVGAFELNVYIPLMARNLLQSITYLAAACRAFATRCVDGITANTERAQALAESTLVLGDRPQSHRRLRQGRRHLQGGGRQRPLLREVALDHGVPADVLDKALDLRAAANGNGYAG